MRYWRSLFYRIYDALYRPMDIAGLAVMRMLFGIIIMYEAWRYSDLIRIIAKFTWQDFYFKYRFFEWVEPLSASSMQWLFILYGAAGLLIFLGLFYRLATLVGALCISYIFLVDATNYLNHFYLIIVFSFTMFFIPADKGWSLYALMRKDKARSTVPGWAPWLIRAQLAIVYFYAAIAKMNVDWINGMPLHDWIGNRALDATGLESYLYLPMVTYFFTYGGLLYDLVVAPLLLFKKTRAFAYCLSLSFHLTNYYLFNIGVFPWFMLATSTIFFDTDWPRNFLNFFFPTKIEKLAIEESPPAKLRRWQRFGLAVMAGHIAFQVLFPLRHFAYSGYASWDEAGHNFSWHMKLRGKGGHAEFKVRDPETGRTVEVNPRRYLTERQSAKMATRPFLLLQFAHFLRDKFTGPGEAPAEVYAETRVRINGRSSQRLIDPQVNLSNISPSEVPGLWVFPLRQPVWNAKNKRNRFGPALIEDDITARALDGLIEPSHRLSKSER